MRIHTHKYTEYKKWGPKALGDPTPWTAQVSDPCTLYDLIIGKTTPFFSNCRDIYSFFMKFQG